MIQVTEDDLPLQRLYRWEQERGSQVFLTQPYDGGRLRHWTWKQTAEEARRMAAYLKNKNWEPGTRVAILSKNCAWWIMADLAISMAGHVTVPIYPSLRAKSIRQILEHSEAKGCFLGAVEDPELGIPRDVTIVSFPTAAADQYVDWDAIIQSTPPVAGSPVRSADDLATIVYTSGTTGTPKGVMHNFRALAFVAKSCAGVVRIDKPQRCLSYLPLAHVVERAGMEMLSLRLGSHLFFCEGLDSFLTDLHRARPTLFATVPRLLLKFQQGVYSKVPKEKLDSLLRKPIVRLIAKRRILRQLGLSTVRLAACGAAPLPPELLLWYRKLGLNLAEGYGMTETWVTHLPGPGQVRAGYVGPPIPGVEQKQAENGELLLKSPMNMVGYYKDPVATRAAFTDDGFFRTGDLVRIDPDGQVKIIGRVKEQFKTSKGKYVAPAPIEGQLVAHPAVEACCLMGSGLPSPCAIVVLTPEARKRCGDPAWRESIEQSIWAQVEAVNQTLESWERVAFVVIADGPWTIENGVMTPTLKIKRNLIEAQYEEFVDEWRRQERNVVWETPPSDAPGSDQPLSPVADVHGAGDVRGGVGR